MYDLIGTMAPGLWTPEPVELDAIPMLWFERGWGAADPDLLTPFLPEAKALLPGTVGALSLIAIKPGGSIPPHEDGTTTGWRRFHFVLRTNDDCWSFHDDNWQRLEARSIYVMDANKIHASVNLGQATRWHLIVDSKQ